MHVANEMEGVAGDRTTLSSPILCGWPGEGDVWRGGSLEDRDQDALALLLSWL